MKCSIALQYFFPGPPRLFLTAETEADQLVLQSLVDHYQLTNAGKDGTDEWQHVAVELKPKESEDA